jgi:isopentenyldiphosphate isomerase
MCPITWTRGRAASTRALGYLEQMPTPTTDTPIDAVDGDDHRIGTVTRGDALRTGSNFRTAHVFVFNRRGELLLQRLSGSRERHPDRWGSSVAAYLYAGETYEHAAVRRLEEELGLSASIRPVGKLEMHDEQSLKFVELFRTQCDQARIAEPDHVAALRFVVPSEISREMQADQTRFTPTFVELFRAFGSSFV